MTNHEIYDSYAVRLLYGYTNAVDDEKEFIGVCTTLRRALAIADRERHKYNQVVSYIWNEHWREFWVEGTI